MQNASGANVGIAYGRIGDNLPSPAQVVSLLQANNVNKVRIYDTDSGVLQAFQNSNIKLIVGAGNDELASLASDGATAWVQSKIVPFASSIEIICVGNEVLTQATQYSQYLNPAIQNVYNALKAASLDTGIHVSTAHAMDVIDSAHAFPPSAGTFAGGIQADMNSILDFLSQTGAPFLANVYPFFTYIGSQDIDLKYALFQQTAGADDTGNGLHYSNLFDAQVDTLIAAMEASGHSDIPVVVTESGWPHQGQDSATVENAQAYNVNLVAHVPMGTPKRPNTLISTYIFALFDENQKPSDPAYEQHFGVFDPTTQNKFYDISF
ncbi:hypothetical protein L7F22_060834 [Adiantum nelumboides]|nr:hypothetical protein [Adiantum nelumboides]MCO5606646.1 hypothetical protein [Adiantum nelumboides]